MAAKFEPIIQLGYHSSTPPSLFMKVGIDLLKFGNKGGDEIFVLERERLN